ncbi:MAG: hypothetical protein WAN36_05160 [Calditrichia bacterium]
MSNQKQHTILLLFPWKKLGKEVISRFLQTENHIILITHSAEDQTFFKDNTAGPNPDLRILRMGKEPEKFWQELPADVKQQIKQSALVINFIGTDFIKMKTGGEGTDWEIDPDQPAQQRFSFITLLLDNIEKTVHCKWINLVRGAVGAGNQPFTFCATRYNIIGFTHLVEMNPKLSGMEMVNICLSYLKHRDEGVRVTHCTHCVAEKYRMENIDLSTSESIADFLVKKSHALMSAG